VPARLVVLASGGGTTLQAILDDPELRPQVVAVGSDKRSATALQRAHSAGVETFVVPFVDYAERSEWNRAFEKALADLAPDLVVLAGFMRIFDAEIVGRFRMVNTHPALLPAFPGAHAVRDALAAGVDTTGVTVHWVDAGVDTGPVIAQQAVAVEPGDDEDTLRERVQAVEKPLYVKAIRSLCQEIS
jgi:formyltetrahydrofolate-dependent phosphoribosylglycinamide formyltransferase